MKKMKVYLRSWFHTVRYVLTREELKRNVAFKNLYDGQACFIVCTGKSLIDMDFSKILNQPVLTCNQFYKHPRAKELKIVGYFDMDPPSSHTCNPDPYWAKGGYHRELAEFANHLKFPIFQRLGMKDFCSDNGVVFDNAWYVQSGGLLAASKNVYFDLAGRANIFDGVVFAMLGAAAYMGFKKIYLLGCDYTLQPLQVGHFYDDTLVHLNEPVDIRHNMIKKFLDSRSIEVVNIIPSGFDTPTYTTSITIRDFLATNGHADYSKS